MCMYMNKSLIIFLLFSLSISAMAYYPGEEHPTDENIWIKIDYANFEIESMDNIAKISIEAEGEASPYVHHCGIAFIVVYKNGSTNYNGVFLEGPINITGDETLVFIPTGNNWSHWKFYNVVYLERSKFGINETDLGNISSFEIWVRGYRDDEGTLWNQTHAILTQNVTKELEEFYEGEGDNKGILTTIIIIVAIALIILVSIYIYKRK